VEIQSVKNRFGIIGNSPDLNYALEVAMQVAPTELTVLITGESGVGKEAFSHIIHQLSPRKHNPFIAVNCGAIPEGTIDSELFGHEKGSFTGAVESRKGYFEFVNEGTIFLDEVGELPHGTQSRLLRVLETKEFIRVGSSKVQKTDVRVIAASNVNLVDRIQQGRFRDDLYYRLNTVPIKVPPLRQRKEDIYLLFRKFAIDFSGRYKTDPVQLDDEAKQMLMNYSWPGNVRELKNIAEQISVLAKDKTMTANELRKFIPEEKTNGLLPMLVDHQSANTPDFTERDLLYKVLFDMKNDLNEMKKVVFGISPGAEQPKFSGSNLPAVQQHYEVNLPQTKPVVIEHLSESHPVEESLSIADKEKELIVLALKKHKGKRKDAATDLGISERTLYRKIKDYNIDAP
jgi:transcriptional regulator with PAS, ATPase and Fis domain